MSRLEVRVTPRAAEDALDGFNPEGVLLVRVAAAPADGAANKAIVKLLAKALDVPARDLVLLSGSRSRHKVFSVPLEPNELAARAQRATAG